MARRYRPPIPLLVKYLAVLRHFGLQPSDIEFDHCPPLGLREYDEATRIYTPPANDPEKIVMRLKADHRAKTSHPLGPHTSVGSDQHMIAKTRHGRGEKFAVDRSRPARPRQLTADRVSLPTDRCRKCGECPEACSCPPPQPRPSFGGRRNAHTRD